MKLTRAFTVEELILALSVTGVDQFSEDGFPLNVHREHPDWCLPKSPYYVNFRVQTEGPLEEWQAEMFGQSLGYFLQQNMRWGSEPVQIVGVPNTGKPLAKGIAAVLGDAVHLLEMFKEGEGKGHIAERIEGRGGPERPVTLIDGVITKGGSKFDAIEVLRKLGYTVERVVVLVDREQGGEEELAAKGVELLAALGFSHILEGSRTLGLIDQAMYDRSVAYPGQLDAAMAAHHQPT